MFIIKKAKKDDLVTISNMDTEVADIYSVKSIKTKNCGSLQLTDSTQLWRRWLDSGNVFKALDGNNKTLGVIVVLSASNKGFYIHKLLTSYIDLNIEKIVINNNLVSKLLIERALVKVDKRESSASVVVCPDDLMLINIYSSLGFKKQNYKRNYLGENQDRLIMSRPINWSDSNKSHKILSLNKNSEIKQEKRSNQSIPNTSYSACDGSLFLKSMNSNNYGVG